MIESISEEDYEEYKNLMYEFSKYDYTITKEKYIEYIQQENPKIMKIIVDDKIIGVGTLFILHKLHYKPVAQIEDVIITKEYQHKGYGKQLISAFVNMAKPTCYKIILHCLDKNVIFYEKCGFIRNGNEMKILL